MGFQFLPYLLTTLPGTVVYHLLVFLGLLVAAGIVLTEWRHTHNPDLRPYLVALGGTMGVHLLSVILAPIHLQTESFLAVISAPFLYAGELLSVSLLVWAFGRRLWGSRQRVLLVGMLVVWGILLLVTTFLWYGEAFGKSLTYPVHSWQVPMWYVLSALVAFGGTFLLSRASDHGSIVPAAFVLLLLGVGSVLGLLGSQAIGGPILIGEGLGRLCYLLGYPLFAVSLYNSVLQDLESYRRDLQTLSQQALRQGQELHSLIEATRSIGEGLDLRGMLGQVVNSVAMGLRADTVAIFLVSSENREKLTLVALYQVLGGKQNISRDVLLKDVPSFSLALRKRQLIFGPHQDLTQLRYLFDVINVEGEGPLLIQPLIRKDRAMGVLVACNDSTKTPFAPDQGQLATTIAVQIAGAVENNQLYGALEVKARELSQLLKLRETELRREEAILESMAEGILVSNAEGRFILLNQASEEILGVHRQDVLGRTSKESLHYYPSLRGELDLDTMLGLFESYETTFELNERRVRVHAAPVLTTNGERLGVVSILQDITREYLAEESKREFIAAISHELRTPLTAIKGYAEVMLSGMAGELPPAFSQFLGVIRENTTKMASLTNNIISVAEIERGRVGLNYRVVDVPEIVHETVDRYAERLDERQLKVDLDLPPDLPAIEVDPNRMRLILDNLLSNAVKFTYPNGRIGIGCRAITGTLGQPTYFSFWVTDTGVGIAVEEQLRIWERFYRAESPLSLEAGGLGIGLTITKALVEAHGGRVWVDSAVGKGSTFTVLLPMQRGQSLLDEFGVAP